MTTSDRRESTIETPFLRRMRLELAWARLSVDQQMAALDFVEGLHGERRDLQPMRASV